MILLYPCWSFLKGDELKEETSEKKKKKDKKKKKGEEEEKKKKPSKRVSSTFGTVCLLTHNNRHLGPFA